MREEETMNESGGMGQILDNSYNDRIRREIERSNRNLESSDVSEVMNDEVMGEVVSSSSLREVNIKPLSSGYIVNVGCQSVAVETTSRLIEVLGEYLNNPTEFEKKWFSKETRNKLENI